MAAIVLHIFLLALRAIDCSIATLVLLALAAALGTIAAQLSWPLIIFRATASPFSAGGEVARFFFVNI